MDETAKNILIWGGVALGVWYLLKKNTVAADPQQGLGEPGNSGFSQDYTVGSEYGGYFGY